MPISSAIRLETKTRNPIDLVERLVNDNEWAFERLNDREIAVEVPGRWCGHSLYFNWRDDVGAMHFTCAFDFRVPENKRAALYELLCRINEKMWIGHFGLWPEEGLPMFRHALLLREASLSGDQLESLVDQALSECERFYPAFQFLVWGGKSPVEALDAAIIETMGEA